MDLDENNLTPAQHNQFLGQNQFLGGNSRNHGQPRGQTRDELINEFNELSE